MEWICSDGMWMQLSFECYVSVWIPYMRKKLGSCMAMVDVCDIGTWLEKIKPGGETCSIAAVTKV